MKIKTMLVGENGDRIDVPPSTMPPSESLTARVVERIWPEQEQSVRVVGCEWQPSQSAAGSRAQP
jgi:hypothetical protein